MNNSKRIELSLFVKKLASELGFLNCGIAKAEFLDKEAPRLEEWLKRGYQGDMQYLDNNFDLRLDPGKLVPGARSVISLLYNYYPEEHLDKEDNYKVAKYAYGKDYHKLIRKKLKKMIGLIREQAGEVTARGFVDSAPVMEREWARRSGLGWIGKNTLLLNRQNGSFFFLAEIITDLELDYDQPVGEFCGTCSKCMEACPTAAITAPNLLDASKCISYFTIELKDEIDYKTPAHFHDWIFGCDICQDVCPWNRFSKPHHEPSFLVKMALKQMEKTDWEELDKNTFEDIFQGSALKRAGWEGIRRNIEYVKRDQNT